MRVTVLGVGPAFPKKGGATSGYLVTSDGTTLLVDCGTGVVSNLQRHVDYHQVTAIIISHMHADHFLDLIPYRYGLKHAPYDRHWTRPRLYLPPGGCSVLKQVVTPFSDAPDFFGEVFQVAEYEPCVSLRVDGLTVRFTRTRHPVPAYAMSIEAQGRRMTYSADSAPTESLVTVARYADLFICEAGLQRREQDAPGGAHLTPSEAGGIAARAGVRRLLLTHLWQEFDQDQMLREARDAFGGPVDLAIENASYEV